MIVLSFRRHKPLNVKKSKKRLREKPGRKSKVNKTGRNPEMREK